MAKVIKYQDNRNSPRLGYAKVVGEFDGGLGPLRNQKSADRTVKR
jgi:hypothetical protein